MMRVHLLGTGSADRWPNPFCACARCAWAREHGQLRSRTSALVDGSLLVDPGPDIGDRGTDLSGVRTVLITHGHPDHLDPAFLLAWTWAHASSLDVAGPPEAIARCRPWVGPRAPVRFREVHAGDSWDAGRLRIRALPAAHSTTGGHRHDGTAVLYEVTGAASLLYATDTAALPHGDLRGPYDLVLLEETFGDVTDHGTAHLDLPAFGREVARLRADGRLTAEGRVVAVHLSHHNPPDVSERLRGIGAEVVPDGTVLAVGRGTTPQRADEAHPRPGRRLLITGGARSGKSRRAESIAAHRNDVHYVATAPSHPDDREWAQRIAEHRARRPPGWGVHETVDVAHVLAGAPPGALVLVDCLTLWVTTLVDLADAWEHPHAASTIVAAETERLLAALSTGVADVVLVTNEVGAGVVPHTASGRLFRDLMGRVNAGVAAACDDVELVVAGLPSTLKGRTWTT